MKITNEETIISTITVDCVHFLVRLTSSYPSFPPYMICFSLTTTRPQLLPFASTSNSSLSLYPLIRVNLAVPVPSKTLRMFSPLLFQSYVENVSEEDSLNAALLVIFSVSRVMSLSCRYAKCLSKGMLIQVLREGSWQ